MKKIYVFLSLVVLSFTLIGCGMFTTAETSTSTFLTSATTQAQTTTKTFDANSIASDIYERIYGEIYDKVKQEVMQNLSDAQFTEIYNAILAEFQQEISDGTIQVTPESIIDMIHQVQETAAKAVVGVSNLDDTGSITAIGSGVIYKHVGDKYFVVTNNHVVEGGTSYQIRFADGSSTTAIVQGVDTLVDVAVLYFISTNDYQVATFANSDQAQQGDIVLAVGNPSGYEFYNSMTMGIISGLNRYFDIDGDGIKDLFVGYIQHDAAINGGNSGGALFDVNGEILGINVIKLADVNIEGMGFAIPGNLVQQICASIEINGYSTIKPMLGITFLDIYNNEAAFAQDNITLPAGITNGFYIRAVTPNATLDGIVQVGDIILQIGDITIENSSQFIQEFTKYRVGDVISIVINRNGQNMTIDNIVLKAKVAS